LPTRWHDPEKDIGNLEPGQSAFPAALREQSCETIVEYGLPFSRKYDPVEELGRIRNIYAAEATTPPRRPQPPFRTRSLRRG
jgi:hypothetical protein